jgi:hypothetical protein
VSLFEVFLIVYLPVWLLAVADATIAKFDRWHHQFGWLLAMFLVPGAPVAYLLFGVNRTTSGGFGFLRRKPKNRDVPRTPSEVGHS